MKKILKVNILKWFEKSVEASSIEFDGNIRILENKKIAIPEFSEILSAENHTLRSLYNIKDPNEYHRVMESCWEKTALLLPGFIVNSESAFRYLLIIFDKTRYHHLQNIDSRSCIYKNYSLCSITRENGLMNALNKFYNLEPVYPESFRMETYSEDGNTSSFLKIAFCLGNYDKLFARSNFAGLLDGFLDLIRRSVPETNRIILCTGRPGCREFNTDNFVSVLNDDSVRLMYLLFHNPELEEDAAGEWNILKALNDEMPGNRMNKYLAPATLGNHNRINFKEVSKRAARVHPLIVESCGCYQTSVAFHDLPEYDPSSYTIGDCLRDSNAILHSYGIGEVPSSLLHVLVQRFDYFINYR